MGESVADHDVHVDVVGRWSEAVRFPVTREALVAYAEATNDDHAVHADGTFASPVFAVVPATSVMADTTLGAVPDELMLRILHGEQDMRFLRPIVPGDDLVSRAQVVGIHGRSSGIVVTTVVETRGTDGELVNEQYFTGFFGGGRLGSGYGEEPPGHAFDPLWRERDPDASVVQKFDHDQTFRYAQAAGDPMPIHLDDEFAKSMGLPGIIVHGLCTMAFTSRAVIERACPDDPTRLKRLAVRFSAPAQPKHAITTDIWCTGVSHGRVVYGFETTNDEGAFVIKDGRAEVAEA